jgi:hypothetical protein
MLRVDILQKYIDQGAVEEEMEISKNFFSLVNALKHIENDSFKKALINSIKKERLRFKQIKKTIIELRYEAHLSSDNRDRLLN